MEENGQAASQDSSAPMTADVQECSVCGRPIGSGESRYDLPDCICCVACFHRSTSLLT